MGLEAQIGGICGKQFLTLARRSNCQTGQSPAIISFSPQIEIRKSEPKLAFGSTGGILPRSQSGNQLCW
ncbi:MAG: hypothetical protein DWQ34_24195 [Planctomycetota bacterium]|nr:MAG: hypothetical protein DWQ29_12880 [Planctomycetota bacterium]REJ87750.1 MAG: hypothetical protein DWQ34_24195 [Planctomycetota bacterium]REK27833.1 MAG: hypothetical protein DWQ41_06945 [Planctomycetota bacterium]REK40287.1 MAG: hypothetical protein DWQ45_00185 [Planctomycetota bacterium]